MLELDLYVLEPADRIAQARAGLGGWPQLRRQVSRQVGRQPQEVVGPQPQAHGRRGELDPGHLGQPPSDAVGGDDRGLRADRAPKAGSQRGLGGAVVGGGRRTAADQTNRP